MWLVKGILEDPEDEQQWKNAELKQRILLYRVQYMPRRQKSKMLNGMQYTG